MPAVGDQHRGGPSSTTMPNTPGTTTGNPFEEPQRRMNEYTAREIATLQSRLDKKLGPEYISSRPGAAGQRVHYLSADKCINLANEVFGFNGWSSSIQNIQIDFVEESQNTGRISLGLSVIVRITLKDGAYHEDIGYGHIENCKGKAAAFEKAKKEGTTDALKRALRNFGNVLGNCVYDKDYVAKVTKMKAVPAKWDIDDLHRHPDFAPIKKEPMPPKQQSEDDDLPPRPPDVAKRESSGNIPTYDGDGEFGSDLFDEADFSVAETGNPDEIVLEPDSRKQQQPPRPPNNQNAQPKPPNNIARAPAPNPAVVTPSKPDRSWAALRQPSAPSVSHGRSNPIVQGRPPGPASHNLPNENMAQIAQTRPNQDMISQAAGGKPLGAQAAPPPSSSPSTGPAPAGFFSARAAEMLRDNPQSLPPGASQFDPHAESPSIRKTAGVDHTKSVPISKPMLTTASPAATRARDSAPDFVNPSQDMHRRIGAPGGSGIGSPLNRAQSTSSYRPLTRPNVDPKTSGNTMAPPNRPNFAPQNINGKRPPLSDVTNGTPPSGGSGPASTDGPVDLKKVRLNEGPPNPAHVQQQPPK